MVKNWLKNPICLRIPTAVCGHSEKDYLLRETDCNSFRALHELKWCLHCEEAAGLCGSLKIQTSSVDPKNIETRTLMKRISS